MGTVQEVGYIPVLFLLMRCCLSSSPGDTLAPPKWSFSKIRGSFLGVPVPCTENHSVLVRALRPGICGNPITGMGGRRRAKRLRAQRASASLSVSKKEL